MGQGTEVWIFGSQIHAYECVTEPTKATLALRGADGWVEVAHARSVLDRKLCAAKGADKGAPYVVKYQFTLKILGQLNFPVPGTHAKLLVYRITNAQGSRQATAAIYEDAGAVSEDQLDGKLPGVAASDEPEPQIQTLATSNSDQSRATKAPTNQALSGVRANLGWRGCLFDGVAMLGRVKFLSVGARFKIRLVGAKAALSVKGVTHPAKTCGEWQFVSAAPAFTVEIVREGEDFTVSLGAKYPGVAN